MSSTPTLLTRNRKFSENFDDADLPILPKLRTVVLGCVDARVDPAHVLGLELGDAVVMRNNGGRVTPEVIDELVALTFMVAKMSDGEPHEFEVVIMQHTQCGAERFADPNLQKELKTQTGVDVSTVAITDHEQSLKGDIELLCNTPEIPEYVVISGYIYDVQSGSVREVVKPSTVSSLR